MESKYGRKVRLYSVKRKVLSDIRLMRREETLLGSNETNLIERNRNTVLQKIIESYQQDIIDFHKKELPEEVALEIPLLTNMGEKLEYLIGFQGTKLIEKARKKAHNKHREVNKNRDWLCNGNHGYGSFYREGEEINRIYDDFRDVNQAITEDLTNEYGEKQKGKKYILKSRLAS